MRILFATPYGPTVTRVRSHMLLDHLSQRHELTLLGLAWNEQDREALLERSTASCDVHVIDHGFPARLRGIVGDPRRPLQQMISTSPPFARAARRLIAEAQRSGRPYDAIHVEHFRGASAIDLFHGLDGHVVYDAVDCLAELARLTALHGPSRLVRQVARFEEPRTRRAESQLLIMSRAITVVAERDRLQMASGADLQHLRIIPNGVPVRPSRTQASPDPRVIFSGKLSYHANQAAVRWFLENVWGRVRAVRPDAQFIVAGADPPTWMLRTDMPGVQVIVNPPDMLELIETTRVAVAPMTYSVGIQNKVLEAMACGVPAVATSIATEGLLDGEASGVRVANHPESFAAMILEFLASDALALATGKQGQGYARRHHSWDAVAQQFEDLYVPARATAKVA